MAVRFLSLEPLKLDLSASPGRVNPLAKNLLKLDTLDFTKAKRDHIPSAVLDLINSSSRTPTAGIGFASTPEHEKSPGLRASYIQSTISIVLSVSNFSLPIYGGTRLKDISALVQQLDVRGVQALYLPFQYSISRRPGQSDLARATAHYINFHNCIWLILNDAIVGIAFGIFLRDNSEVLSEILAEYTRKFTVDLIREALIWLDNWPVGLKLNTELSRFIFLFSMGLIDVWSNALSTIETRLSTIVYAIGFAGPLGMTMVLSMFSDLLSILTTSMYLSYLAATGIFRAQLSMAGSLFNLFQGKRRNVLRNRIDSWDYDLDQLLLGTILFTLLAFLFPTVLVYYLLFAIGRLCTIMLYAALETCLAFMNHFPLFAMMLRLKDPARLPGGVYCLLEGNPPRIIVKNNPIPFSHIFFQHLRVWSRLSAHYHPVRLLRCLFSGAYITPISRYSIRYDAVGLDSPSK